MSDALCRSFKTWALVAVFESVDDNGKVPLSVAVMLSLFGSCTVGPLASFVRFDKIFLSSLLI